MTGECSTNSRYSVAVNWAFGGAVSAATATEVSWERGSGGWCDDVDVRSIFLTLEIKVLTEHARPPALTQVARAGGQMRVARPAGK